MLKNLEISTERERDSLLKDGERWMDKACQIGGTRDGSELR